MLQVMNGSFECKWSRLLLRILCSNLLESTSHTEIWYKTSLNTVKTNPFKANSLNNLNIRNNVEN